MNEQTYSTVEPMRVWRARKGWSQAELARQAGVDRLTIHRAEHGQSKLSPLSRRAITAALNVDPTLVEELRR